jgi:Ca-activated chloride channel family protein
MFESPQWLWLLPGVLALTAVYVVVQLRRRRYVARFSNAGLLASIAPKRPGWRRHLTFATLLLALTVLSVGVARPTAAVRVPREEATVMLALDVSLSMQATDVLPTRIDAAKKAAIEFADLLPPKINLGLVAFAKSAEVKVPPTIDRDSFKAAVSSLELRESTAIGDAVEACLDAIRTFAASTAVKGSKSPPAQIVLLSDGTSNTGKKPLDAAQDAVKQKVPVATIAFGTPSGPWTCPARASSRCRLTGRLCTGWPTPLTVRSTPRSPSRNSPRSTRTLARRSATRSSTATLAGASWRWVCSSVWWPRPPRCSGRAGWFRADLLVRVVQDVLLAQRLGPVIQATSVQRGVEVLDGEQRGRRVEQPWRGLRLY